MFETWTYQLLKLYKNGKGLYTITSNFSGLTFKVTLKPDEIESFAKGFNNTFDRMSPSYEKK